MLRRTNWSRLVISKILVVLFVLIGGIISQAGDNGSRKIVVFKKHIATAERIAILDKHELKALKHLNLVDGIAIEIPETGKEKILAALAEKADILRIDDDLIITAIDDTQIMGRGNPRSKPSAQQVIPWGVDRIDADLAWASSQGTGIKVAVIDTGIDIGHPDLKLNIKGGINTINPRKSFDDDNGHGTHVSGIIAAADNTIGVIGVGPGIYLYGVKALSQAGTGYLSDLIEGLEWCINNRMKVVNMSLSSSSGNESFQEAIAKTYAAGIVLVAAAGNSGSVVEYPAKYPETIAVSAINNMDQFAYFSNYGPEVDITAPGVDIGSTYRGGTYKNLNGTSMAAPHVAGACALKLAKTPGLTPDNIKTMLAASAEVLPGLSRDQQGAGLVDVEKLVLQ